MYNVYALCNGILQCFGARAGAARNRSFMLEPEPKKNTFSAPAPAIIQKKYLNNQHIFSNYV